MSEPHVIQTKPLNPCGINEGSVRDQKRNKPVTLCAFWTCLFDSLLSIASGPFRNSSIQKF